jgi:hypothetical protein
MSVWSQVRRALIGPPKDVKKPEAFHSLSLVALLAWVGLGADGLSSSAYGPEEAFRTLGEHRGLAVFLALAVAGTVFIISYGYNRIIEQFPSGGGGYLVASKVLGSRVGVVAGSALLVDYVLTITISVAAGTDAIFSFLPHAWLEYKIYFACGGIALLSLLNLRGVKESVTAIAPVFVLFLVTHAVLLLVAIGGHLPELPAVTNEVRGSIAHSFATLGTFGGLKLLMHAYSLGGGTFTGIEGVANGVGLMREPRVVTARKTMALMAISLAITASGLLVAYLLFHAEPVAGRTMNAVLLERVAGGWRIADVNVGRAFVVLALLSEGALLFVAAQSGFLAGPRVMATMAVDSWLPHRYSALSERLTMRNGIMLMGGAALIALLYTGGRVSKLVVMYSINVFVDFSLSNIAMSVFWLRHRDQPEWRRHLPAHILAALLCVLILVVTVIEKFLEGGWITLVATTALVTLCLVIRRHYRLVVRAIRRLDRELPGPEESPEAMAMYAAAAPAEGEPDPKKPIAIVFVGGYGGLGRHALLTLLRMFPGHFKGVVFASIAVVDSDVFKGAAEVQALEERTRKSLADYVRFASVLGLPASTEYAVGTEVAIEAEKLAANLMKRYPKALVVAGQIIFEDDTMWNRLLHNETAFLIQRRLQHEGVPMIVLPVELDLSAPHDAGPSLMRGAPARSVRGQRSAPSRTSDERISEPG